MEERKFIDELIASRKFPNSLVAFLPELLRKFFSGEIDEATFKKEFDDKACQAKMYLAYMGEYIKVNQRIFKNEFQLVDKIGDDIYYNNLSGREFRNNLKRYIKHYNLANKDESGDDE